MPDHIPILSISIAALPVPECSPLLQLSSTPFASRALPDRFEYPFPITEPLLSIPPALLAATLLSTSSTQTLPNGSLVPPSGTGRGMGMSSFASFSQRVPTIALPYPSATASASQVLDQTQADALPVDLAYIYDDHHHYTASQLCVLASANSPMPPSLVLKRHGKKLSTERLRRKRSATNPNDGLGIGIEGFPEV